MSPGAPRSPFALLRHREYRLLWLGLLISNTGSWMQFVALGYLVDRLTHAPLYLGLLALAQAIPRIIFALVGGAIADRVDRRAVLLWTNTTLLVSAAVLTLLTATGAIQIWHVLTLGALNSLVNAFDMPARQALMPTLVDEEEMLPAITLNAVAFNGAGIWGPSLGGVVIALVGEAGAFLTNALSYLAVLGALLLMRLPPHEATGRLRVGEDVGESLRMLRRQPRLLAVLGIVGVTSFFGRSYIRLMPALARAHLHVDSTGLGLLQAAPGVGTVLAVLLLGPLRAAGPTGRLLGLAATLFGASVVAFSLSPWFGVSLAVLVLVGVCQTLFFSTANSLLQTSVAADARGRVMGLYNMLNFGLFTLGVLPAGALAEITGVPAALALGGAVVLLLGLLGRRALAAMG